MKKIFLIMLFCLFICGCGVEEFQISELKPISEYGKARLSGTIKNVSNKNCKKVEIDIEYSNGSIKDTGWITVESPKIGEYKSFNTFVMGATNIDNFEDYKIKIKNVECWIKNDTK